MKTKIFRLLALIAGILVLSSAAWSQETYNFYFQKAPGPTTVIQGSSGQPTPSTTTPVAAEATPVVAPAPAAAPVLAATTEKKVEADSQHRSFRVALGYGKFDFFNPGAPSSTKFGYEGVGLNLGYRLNPYFGFDFGGVSGKLDPKQEDIYGYYQVDPPRGATQLYTGIVITPIHLNLFGWNLLEVSLLGGGAGFMGSFKARTVGYYGAAVDFIVNPSFSIGVQAKAYGMNGEKYSSVTALASARF